MHQILSKLLKKRGIDDPQNLDADERKDFDNWNLILNKEELTVDDIRHFCQSQLGVIEGKWSDYNLDNEKKSQLIPYHTVYKMLLSAIDSPKIAREAVERQLNQLIK